MAIFRGVKNRDDTFTGSGKSDRFEFDPRDLNSGDTVVGGAGKAIDVLRLTAPGAVGVTALAHVSGIERIELADGGANSLVLSNAFVASANGARVQVVGGSGDDLIYATDLHDGSAIDFISNGGTDYVFAGEGDDIFTFDVGTLDGNDRVEAGAGEDTLVLRGSGSVSADQLFGLQSIGTVLLGDGGVSIAITDAFIYSLGDATLTVAGGAGDDVIDAGATSVLALTETLSGGAGDDTITIGAGSYNLATVDGGAGADTIRGGVAAVVYDANDVSVAVAGGMLVLRGGGRIDLTRADDQSLDDANVVTGFTSASAAGSDTAVTLTGGAGMRLIGGAGSDVLTGAGLIQGGKGADMLVGGADGTYFILADHEFARGETIMARGTTDTLAVTGENDIRRGTVTGIESLVFGDGSFQSAAFGTLYANASQLTGVTALYATNLGDALNITMARGDLLLPSLQGGNYFSFIDVTGSSGADSIQVPGIRDVHAGGGGDTIKAIGTIFGEAGDDTVTTNIVGDRAVDGGDGIDTFKMIGDVFQFSSAVDLVINLSRPGDQLSLPAGTPHVTLSHFENVDLSGFDTSFFSGSFKIVGDAGANVLTGGRSATSISGGAGDDVLRGQSSDDTLSGGDGSDTINGGLGTDMLSGGAGSDRFTFTDPGVRYFESAAPDTITDYTVGQDKLVFARQTADRATLFDYSGNKFDTVVEASSRSANLKGADLIVYTAGKLNGAADVADWLSANGTAPSSDGLFVVAENAAHHAVLYYVEDSRPFGLLDATETIANLGKIAPDAITLSDFAFI